MTGWDNGDGLLAEGFSDVEIVGSGSSGSVFRATQQSLDRTVAVKVFRHFAGDGNGRILAEAHAQAGLSWHGNVISLIGDGVTPSGFPYLVMEYAPGGSLKDRVEATGPLPESEWSRVGAELASALAAAHATGVVHCDVKPSNVLFAADGSVRLADFGIAKATGGTTGTIDSIEGSLGYVAPELLDGERPQPANDIYSLALTLGYARSGRPPLDDELTLAQAVAAVTSGVPVAELGWDRGGGAASEILHRACARTPASRPDASEIAGVLEVEPQAETEGGSAGSPRRVGAMVAIAAVLAIVALVAALLVRSPGREIETVAVKAETFDLCAEYETFVADRERLLTDVAEELEQSTSPTDVVRRLLHDYPHEFAALARPFIQQVVDTGAVTGEITADQLANVVIAENLRVLDGGKVFLFDGEGGSFDPAGLPVFLYEPARVFSAVNEHAITSCPNVEVDISPRKARLSSAIFSNLSNPAFMEAFYSDPDSYDVLDARGTLLITTYAWDFFEGLLEGHADWLFEMLDRHPDIRRVLSLDRPEVLLHSVKLDPSLAYMLERPEWFDELQNGLDLLTPAARVGISEVYRQQIEQLGLVLR